MVRTWLGAAMFAALIFAQSSAAAQCIDGEGTEYNDQATHDDDPCWVCVGTKFEPLPAGARCGPELWCEQDQVWASECVPGTFQGEEGTVCESRGRGSTCPQGQTCNDSLGYCTQPCGDAADCSGGRSCIESVCQYDDPLDRPDPPPVEMDEPGGGGDSDMGPPDFDFGAEPQPGDMQDMRSQDEDMASTEPDMGEPSTAKEDEGGCRVTAGNPAGAGLLALLIGLFLAATRRVGGL